MHKEKNFHEKLYAEQNTTYEASTSKESVYNHPYKIELFR